jgi:hypothetical protein
VRGRTAAMEAKSLFDQDVGQYARVGDHRAHQSLKLRG